MASVSMNFHMSRIFTLDSDFNLYRKERRRIIPTIIPG
jgi:hypothetical protein